MDLKKWKLLLIVMVCYIALVIAKPLQLSSKHSYSNKHIFYYESNTQDTTYLFAVCDMEKSEKKICNVLLKTDNFDGANETIVCPVSLSAAFGNTIYPNIQVVLVGKDKAAVLWTEENERDHYLTDYTTKFYLNIINVHMRDGCRKNEIRTLLPVEQADEAHGSINVLPFDDTYDVMLPDVFCNNQLCKGTFDVNGNIIANISSWDPLGTKQRTEHLVNLNKHSRKIGYLTLAGSEDDEIQFIFIKDDANMILKTWDKTEYISPEVKYSIGCDTLGACLLFDYINVNCTFYNFDGTVKQEATMKFDHKHFRSIHNLPEGFLTITKECLMDGKFITPQWMCPHNLNYFVTRYDGQSNQVKKIEIEGHDWDNNEAFDYFKNNAGEHCVTITKYEYLQFLQVNSYCFPEL